MGWFDECSENNLVNKWGDGCINKQYGLGVNIKGYMYWNISPRRESNLQPQVRSPGEIVVTDSSVNQNIWLTWKYQRRWNETGMGWCRYHAAHNTNKRSWWSFIPSAMKHVSWQHKVWVNTILLYFSTDYLDHIQIETHLSNYNTKIPRSNFRPIKVIVF